MTDSEIVLKALAIRDDAERARFLAGAYSDAAQRGRVEEQLRVRVATETGVAHELPLPSASTFDNDSREPAVRSEKAPPSLLFPGSFEELSSLLSSEPVQGGKEGEAGSRLGNYHLLQRLGEGGMGTVYLAEQEAPVRRRVALKVIKTGHDSSSILARFEQERQALAIMDHPNIARVFDAGTTDSGRPFFVMELVKGVPLTQYCDEARLTPRERLDLFAPVCEAVQHAHTKGIIHRDLKPSNILIGLYDGKPIPKIIDFGIAKATAGPLTERTLFTEVGSFIGTPEYMAPEQAELNNLDVDTRSDIYSLGVVLYELLTGSPPFSAEELRRASFLEMLRMIRETEPPSPSTRLASSASLPAIAALRRLEPGRLTSAVSGELDWIVMKCLEKERSRRYESAADLARDIGCHLADLPVLAGPPSRTYILRKTLRRHRRAIAVAGAFIVLLAAAAVTASVLAIWGFRAEEQADERGKASQSNYELARQSIKAFVATLNKAPELEQADLHPLRKQLLQTAIPFYEELSRRAPANLEQAIERIGALYELAALRSRIGEGDAALRDMDECERLCAELMKRNPGRDDLELLLGDAKAQRGWVLEGIGNREDSRRAHLEALEIHEQVSSRHPDNLKYLDAVANDHFNLGVAAQNRADLDDADEHFQRAEAAYGQIKVAKPDAPQSLTNLIQCARCRGQVLAARGRLTEALQVTQRAWTLTEELIRKTSETAQHKSLEATVRRDLALLLWRLHRYEEAEKQLLAQAKVMDDLHSKFPSRVSYWVGVVESRTNLGGLYSEVGRYQDADAQLVRATAETDAMEERYPQLPTPRQDGAVARMNRANSFLNHREPAKAEPLLREAASRLERAIREPAATYETAMMHAKVLSMLGEALRVQNKQSESLAIHRQAVEKLKAQAAAHPDVQEIASALATALKNLLFAYHPTPAEARNDAEAACKEALEAGEKLGGAAASTPQARRELATILAAVADLETSWGRVDQAREHLERSASLRETLVREASGQPQLVVELTSVYRSLASLERLSGNLPRAVEWMQKAMARLAPLMETQPNDPFTRNLVEACWKTTGFLQLQRGSFAESARAWEQAASLASAARPLHQLGRAVAESLAREDSVGATAACDGALKLSGLDAGFVYDMSCIAAVAGGALPADHPARDPLLDRALELLRSCVRLGFRDAAHISMDSDLESLRGRQGFQALLRELEPQRQ